MSFTIPEFASLLVAASAVAIALWSGVVSRRHARLSVQPRLRISHRFRGATRFYGIRIVNAGLGPAVIRRIVIAVDRAPVDDSHQGWKGAITRVGLDASQWHITRLLPDTVVSANEEVWLFRADQLTDTPNAVIKKLSRVDLRVDYLSLYGVAQPPLIGKLGQDDLIIGDEDVPPAAGETPAS